MQESKNIRFVVLPKGETGSCLGLLDKYAGFTAIESIYQDGDTQIVILRESGTAAWLTEKDPKKVMANALDMTGEVEKKDKLYTVPLPEVSSKTVLSITW